MPPKKDRLSEWIQKQDSYICCLQETHLKTRDTWKWLAGKRYGEDNSKWSAGDLGLIPGSGRSFGEGRGNPVQYSCLKNRCGQKSPAGYSPWGHRELAQSWTQLERLSTHTVHHLHQFFFFFQQWPQDWRRSAFIPIPKKSNAKECSNYHTIALISHDSKVMLKIILITSDMQMIPLLWQKAKKN